MPRDAITVVNTPGDDSDASPVSALGGLFNHTNGAEFAWAPDVFLNVTGIVGGQELTIASIASDTGRTGDIVFTPAAGEHYLIGPFDREGWEQSDGNVYVDGDATGGIFIAAIRMVKG